MHDQEQELKLLIQKDQAQDLLNRLPIQETRHQVNTYYDTPNKALRQKLNAFRLRELPHGEVILTIKKPINATTKYEYERVVQSNTLEELNEEEKAWANAHLEGIATVEDLQPLVRFETTRSICNQPEAEISIDHTVFANHDDYEIEYEYRQDHDGIQRFNEILKPLHLHWEKNGLTKLSRALEDQTLFNH